MLKCSPEAVKTPARFVFLPLALFPLTSIVFRDILLCKDRKQSQSNISDSISFPPLCAFLLNVSDPSWNNKQLLLINN